MNIAIILAGGIGTRVGENIPKQFIKIQGKPILAYTTEIFQNHKDIDAIEIVCHKDWIDEVKDIIQTYEFSKVKWITNGGSTYQESVMNGVFYLKDKISPKDMVVVSHSVSPLITKDIISDSIKVCKEHGNGVAAEDITLSTCIEDDEYCSSQNLIRETIKGLSNPLTFNFGELCEVYEISVKTGLINEVEPHTVSLYFALGKKIWFSKTNSNNFKITTHEDLDRFEGLLLLKQKREKEESSKK